MPPSPRLVSFVMVVVVIVIVIVIVIIITPTIERYPNGNVAAGIDGVDAYPDQGTEERSNGGNELPVRDRYQQGRRLQTFSYCSLDARGKARVTSDGTMGPG